MAVCYAFVLCSTRSLHLMYRPIVPLKIILWLADDISEKVKNISIYGNDV